MASSSACMLSAPASKIIPSEGAVLGKARLITYLHRTSEGGSRHQKSALPQRRATYVHETTHLFLALSTAYFPAFIILTR